MTRRRLACATVLVAAILGGGASAVAASGSEPAASPRALSAQAYIAYVRGGDKGPISVWLAKADGGGAHRLAIGSAALLSPNGADVAVQRYATGGASLDLYSTSGKLLAGFFDAAKDTATALRWSANSRYLLAAVSSNRPSGGGGLALIDSSTLKSRVIARGAIYGASFSPAGAFVVFGRASSVRIPAVQNLYTARVAGGAPAELTTNGNSFDPLWTPAGIVFDRSTYRGPDQAPSYQLWIDSSGKFRQLTDLRVPPLLDGLSPIAADGDGNRLIAEYTGEDTSYAWTVQLSPLAARPLRVAGKQVEGAGISVDGQRLLVDSGAFEQSPNNGEVESVAFGGGSPIKLAQGAQPSWSR